MTKIIEFFQLRPGVLIAIGVFILIHILAALIYLIPKLVFRKQLPVKAEYLFGSLMAPLFIILEIMRPPRWRKKWLERSGVKKGLVVLEEGFGFGGSPMIASKIVGPKGKVYALDIMPINVAVLWIRAKLRQLKNLNIIHADAKYTGLADKSVDIVFICDALHDFSDKKGTVKELFRVLRKDGIIAILEDSINKAKYATKLVRQIGSFSLLEQEGKFCKFQKIES